MDDANGNNNRNYHEEEQQQQHHRAPQKEGNGNNKNDDEVTIEIIAHTCDDLRRFRRQFIGEDRPFRVVIVPSDGDDNTVLVEDALKKCNNLIEAVIRNVITKIDNDAFLDCRNLRRIELPEGIIELGGGAFYNCRSLRGRIVIPRSVQVIGEYCFSDCKSLQVVVFHPTANMELRVGVFEGCEKLRSVTLPQNLQLIPFGFLYQCISLEEIQLPESVREIGHYAFAHSGLRSIDLSDNIRTINEWAFAECTSLQTVKIRASSSSNLRVGVNILRGFSSLSVIKTYPWIWSKIFASMNDDPEFIMKFFRQYHNHMFDLKHLIMMGRRLKKM